MASEKTQRQRRLKNAQARNRFVGPSVASVAAIAGGAAFLSMAPRASATVIIEDNFGTGAGISHSNYGGTTPAHYQGAGLTPSTVDLPGTTWQPGSTQLNNIIAEYPAGYAYETGNGIAGMRFRSDNGNSVDISLGAYNTGVLQISADILYNNVNNSGPHGTPPTPVTVPTGISANQFEIVGFNGQNDSSGSQYDGRSVYKGGPNNVGAGAGFTGLRVNSDGSLQEFDEGVAVGMRDRLRRYLYADRGHEPDLRHRYVYRPDQQRGLREQHGNLHFHDRQFHERRYGECGNRWPGARQQGGE